MQRQPRPAGRRDGRVFSANCMFDSIGEGGAINIRFVADSRRPAPAVLIATTMRKIPKTSNENCTSAAVREISGLGAAQPKPSATRMMIKNASSGVGRLDHGQPTPGVDTRKVSTNPRDLLFRSDSKSTRCFLSSKSWNAVNM